MLPERWDYLFTQTKSSDDFINFVFVCSVNRSSMTSSYHTQPCLPELTEYGGIRLVRSLETEKKRLRQTNNPRGRWQIWTHVTQTNSNWFVPVRDRKHKRNQSNGPCAVEWKKAHANRSSPPSGGKSPPTGNNRPLTESLFMNEWIVIFLSGTYWIELLCQYSWNVAVGRALERLDRVPCLVHQPGPEGKYLDSYHIHLAVYRQKLNNRWRAHEEMDYHFDEFIQNRMGYDWPSISGWPFRLIIY